MECTMNGCGRSIERFSRALLAIALAYSALSCRAPATDPAAPLRAQRPLRPNILFLFADDQRADTIAAWGNSHIRTPSLDRLAGEGFSLREMHCFGSIHGAVCVPSRAMMMSGRSLYRVPMDLAGVKTLPEHLADAGYSTFATGKWHNGEESFQRAFQEGRRVFFGGMCDHTQVPLRDLVEGTLTDPRTGDRFSSELFADAATEFLKEHDRTRPFFAYVAFTAPHDPRQPPEEFRQEYLRHPPPLPPNYLPQHPFQNGWLTGRDETLAPWPRPEEMIRDQLAEYYGMITHLDAQVGRILRTLDDTGLARNTIVIYAADHGLALGSHGLLGKQNLYEHSMRALAIVRGPGIPRGESKALAYLFDLVPTLLEIAGAPVPDDVEGRSLLHLIEGRTTVHRDRITTYYEDIQRAVRDDSWKLIRYPKIDHVQLFDLLSDPHEMRNLATDSGQEERVARMSWWIESAQKEFGDPHPLEVENPAPMEIDLTGRARKPDRWQPAWIVEKYFGKD